jgi:hypothetical protein
MSNVVGPYMALSENELTAMSKIVGPHMALTEKDLTVPCPM